MSAHADQIEAFLSGPVQVRRLVADMSRDQIEARPVPGRWSTLEVVCHLTDSDQAWCHRMKRVIAEHLPLLIGYDETRFTAAMRYHDRKLEPELALMEAMRRQMGDILRSLPEEAWSRAGVHNERGLVTLEEMVGLETEHVAHHVRFLVEKRQALGLSAEPA
ncbi:DinB family protein [Aquisphaera insulae]|uniref:DinB family protein n=1 Tax=Aquisphaera insulae TaxID=2712864 RepID=UPI0013EAC0A1|nr:DinB family protein [Aquisphaera insulae]